MTVSTLSQTGRWPQFRERLNGRWHEPALYIYLAIVLAHWAEHIVQGIQIFALGMARPDSRGVLGQFWPWLVKSEALHYGYAIVMLVGLWVLRSGFTGRSRFWWMMAFWFQFWHHIEHGILQLQALFDFTLFGSPVPISIVQLWIPRVELHMFYNTIVFIPMVIAMYLHRYDEPEHGAEGPRCSCARPRA